MTKKDKKKDGEWVMNDELTKNIKKINLFSSKMEKLKIILLEEKYLEAYKAIAALIEMACMMLLVTVYKENVEDTNIILLDKLMNKHNEKEIHKLLIDINGEYNYIDLSNITELEINSLIGNLDGILQVILEKHGNIFEK